MNTNITMIPTDKLLSHPNNPRDDLGDLTELTESIRTVGILQNLTVVPYDPVAHAAITLPDPAVQDYYVTIIGHRRRAAAATAQMPSVPAVVASLTPAEQIGLMQVENCMREGITPYQQAKSMQIMLDLGESVASIAQKTGFSATTVRNRVKLLDLEQDKFQEAEARGATMSEYLALNAIADPVLRNKVLESVGTNNFQYQLKSAIDREKTDAKMDRFESVLDAFAQKLSSRGDNKIVVKTIWSTGKMEMEAPADASTVQYYYTRQPHYFEVYREKTAADTDAEAQYKQIQTSWHSKYVTLEEASLRAFATRMDFVRNLSHTQIKKEFRRIASAMTQSFLRNEGNWVITAVDHVSLSELVQVQLDEKQKAIAKEVSSEAFKCPERTLFLLWYLSLESNQNRYVEEKYSHDVHYSVPLYKTNVKLDEIYDLLTKLGYPMADEEKQMRDGSHPLFYRDPAEQASVA